MSNFLNNCDMKKIHPLPHPPPPSPPSLEGTVAFCLEIWEWDLIKRLGYQGWFSVTCNVTHLATQTETFHVSGLSYDIHVHRKYLFMRNIWLFLLLVELLPNGFNHTPPIHNLFINFVFDSKNRFSRSFTWGRSKRSWPTGSRIFCR